jgi:small-conductance mechanosensitive channel
VSIADIPSHTLVWIGRGLLAVLATALFLFFLRRTAVLLARMYDWAAGKLRARGHGLGIRKVDVIPLSSILAVLRAVFSVVRVLLWLTLFYGWVLAVAAALDKSQRVVQVFVVPLTTIVGGALQALFDVTPNLVALAAIGAVTYGGTHIVGLVARVFEDGRLTLGWLDKDLVVPTRRLANIVLWLLALVAALPYLPGSESKAFQGVSVFVGLLLSLGSTSVISNLLAGLVLTYTRAFRAGDRVKIGDVYGDVVSLGAFTTRVRTTKDEEVVLPNSLVQSGAVMNFRTFVDLHGVQLSSTVTIGYDVPWRTVHRLLVGAALHVEGLKHDPEPYVIQKALDDFYVRYEIRAYTDRIRELHLVEGRLNQAIQDEFFREGVEICSPHFGAFRDGNAAAIPPGRRGAPVEVQTEPKLAPDPVRVESAVAGMSMPPPPPSVPRGRVRTPSRPDATG